MAPNRMRIEQLIIGSMLLFPASIDRVLRILTDKMFEDARHKVIVAEIAKTHAAHRPVRRVGLVESIGEMVGEANTAAYLAALESMAAKEDSAALDDDIDMIANAWTKAEASRRIERTLADLKGTKPSSDIIQSLVEGLEGLLTVSSDDMPISLYEAAQRQVEHTAEAFRTGRENGYSTGLPFVETLTGPWMPGQFVIIGAPTKVGKSALAMQCATGIGRFGDVLYFSFEMTPELLAGREIAKATGIATMRQRAGRVSPAEYETMVNVVDNLSGLHSVKIVASRRSATEIFEYARRYARNRNIVAVFVDHLGLVKPEKGSRSTSDWEVAANAAPILKQMAEELHAVVVGVSQVLKEAPVIGKIKDRIAACLRRPSAYDLKGAIANDADHVVMPFRPEAMLSKIEPHESSADRADWLAAMDSVRGKAEIGLTLSRESYFPRWVDVQWNGAATEFRQLWQQEAMI